MKVQKNKVMKMVESQPMMYLLKKYDSEVTTLLEEQNVKPSLEVFNFLLLGYVIGRREMRKNG